MLTFAFAVVNDEEVNIAFFYATIALAAVVVVIILVSLLLLLLFLRRRSSKSWFSYIFFIYLCSIFTGRKPSLLCRALY